MTVGTGVSSSVETRIAQAVVLRHREQMIDHLEPLGALGIVDPGNLHQLLVVELVAQRAQHVGDALAGDVDRDLADLVLRRR